MLNQKLKYYLDNMFSKGIITLILFLTTISIFIVLVLSILVWSLKITSETSLIEQIWQYLMLVTKGDPTDGAVWSYRLITQIIVLTGLFITSVLIGLLSATFKNKFEKLSEGTSYVLESNHTVIIGWSAQTITIINELIEANRSQKNPCIVILGNINKSQMDEEIRKKIPDFKNTKIVCRKGNPIEVEDLKRVSLSTSRSIIVLPMNDQGDCDTATIKIILAIVNDPNRKKQKYNIVGQISNKKNLIVGDIIGSEEVTLVHANDMLAKIIVQTSRQPGLSTVYTDLLDFEGSEIYFNKESKLIGKTFNEAALSYDTSSVIGIVKNKTPFLNPKADIIIEESDELIIISEDDGDIYFSKADKLKAQSELRIQKEDVKTASENVLILGWNSSGDSIIKELDKYAQASSQLVIANDCKIITERSKKNPYQMKNQSVSYKTLDITDRDSLDQLDYQLFDHVIILSCNERYPTEQADSNTILTLIHVRDIEKKNDFDFSIVSQILNTKNRDLIASKKVDDFVASEKVISFLITQISERKELHLIFRELFREEGSEVYFKPITNYIDISKTNTFYDILQSSLLKKQIAIGFRTQSDYFNQNKNYGIVLNPKKSKEYSFSENDSLIVLSEN